MQILMALALTGILATTALSGCSTTNSVLVNATPRATLRNVGAEPEINSKQTVDVGSTIYSEFEYDVYFDATLASNFTDSRGLGSVSVPEGERLTGVRAPDGTIQFCSTKNFYRDPAFGPYDIVCFADTNSDMRFESFRVPSILLGNWKAIDNPVNYNQDILDIAVDQGKGLKLELIYQGLDDNDIKLAYREYIDNMARPAFSQMVEYEKENSGDTEIAFKGSRIVVHHATSNSISYTVLKGFEK